MSPDKIAIDLRRSLLSGEVRPGAELSQVTLADRFGVSRIPIRDALRILEGEGLVEIEPNRGARAITLGPAELREIYELRVLLECDCLHRSIVLATDAQIDEADRIRRRSDLDATTARWSEGDLEFHNAIYRPSGRDRQIALIEGLRRTCQLFVGAYASIPAQTPRWLSDHRAIIDRMRVQDVEGAVGLLRTHIEGAMNHLLAMMGQSAAGTTHV